MDQSEWPAHLRDDAPYKTCDTCGRKSWSRCRVGTSCGMPQPSGSSCEGHFTSSMPEINREARAMWFVYTNTDYYPWATIVEADDADAAIVAAEMTTHTEGVAVFPLDSLALWKCGYSENATIKEVLGDA